MKVATLLTLRSTKIQKIMKQERNNAKDILQNVKMDASVNFMANGDINIYPCPWESDKEVPSGRRVRYRGGIEVDSDGRTQVKRYNEGTGPKHETLFETAHGVVKMTRLWHFADGAKRAVHGSVYVTFKFPKKSGLTLMKALYKEEVEEVMAYLKSRKEETLWG